MLQYVGLAKSVKGSSLDLGQLYLFVLGLCDKGLVAGAVGAASVSRAQQLPHV